MSFSASQNAFAQALLHAAMPVPPGVTSARGEADAARFSVYRNNVFVGLTKALAQRFPVTERLVGTDFFTAMARAFAQDHKPRSPLIIDYGDGFPDFIAGFGPAADLRYLADVAAIEAAWTRAYHAADRVPLGLDGLSIEPDRLLSATLLTHPSAHIVESAYPAGSIWEAHQQEVVEPPKAWQAETVLVVRPHMTVTVHILPVRDRAFARALVAGATLEQAADAAMREHQDFDFGEALVGLITLGAFSIIDEGH